MIVMTEAQWEEKYNPSERLYDTAGEDLEFVLRQPANCVWAMMDICDEEYLSTIVNGYGPKDRIGFFISEKPFVFGEKISINLCPIFIEEST